MQRELTDEEQPLKISHFEFNQKMQGPFGEPSEIVAQD